MLWDGGELISSLKVDTGSEDTFREMLRIKRSVQAAFNTEYVCLSFPMVKAI